MEKVSVTVEVAKETYELGQGISAFVGAVKTALADGWQPGVDLPPLLTAAFSDLVPAIQGVQSVDDEAALDPTAFARAVGLGLGDIASHFLKKA